MVHDRKYCYYDAYSFQRLNLSRDKKQLSLLHLNSQSLRNKKEAVDILLDTLKHNFDFLAFTETWFTSCEDAVPFTGYNRVTVCRENKRGGGVAIYIHDSLKFDVISEYTVMASDFESVMVRSENLFLVVIYRPPSGTASSFLDFVRELLEFCELQDARVIVTGDFNIDMLSTSATKQNLLDTMLCFGYENQIHVPTRVTETSETLLDLCFTNCKSEICAGVVIPGVSDHFPIFASIRSHKTKWKKINPTYYRKITTEKIQTFQGLVIAADWSEMLQITEPVHAYEAFMLKITQLYDQAFPLVLLKTTKKARKPWIDASLLKRIKERDNLFSTFIKTKQIDYLRHFKQFRNKLGFDIKRARIQYYEHRFAAVMNDQKAVWNTMNDLLFSSNKKTITELTIEGKSCSGTLLADMFNNHFLKSGACENSASTDTGCEPYITKNVTKSIFLAPTDESEVHSFIMNLPNNSAAGVDGIKAEPLKAVSQYISLPLSHICNLILSTGVFPDKLKIARVSIIHKGGNENDLNNYRPISVLPIFSKVIERVLYVRITNFCSQENIITKQQYGFQKKKSTEQALLSIKDKIINNFEQRYYTLGIFLDFKKAFDSIKHEILLVKLNQYGIRGVSLKLISSYLTNRFQYCVTQHAISKMDKIKYGVPQGSILGPLLFLLYINDIINIRLTPDMVLYADDTNVFFSGKDIDSLEKQANRWLQHLSIWLTANKLELNTKKTKYVIFRPKNKRVPRDIQVKFRGDLIERVTCQKFLGIIFHETLDWTYHINKVRTDLSRQIGVIGKIRCFLPIWVTKQLYYSLVYSRIHYCLLIWGTTTKTNKESIHKLQKRIVRIIEGVRPRTHSTPLFHKHNILTFENIIYKKIAAVIYDKLKSNAVAFHDAYSQRHHTYSFRRITYCSERMRTNYGTQKLTHMIPKLLNVHPTITTIVQESRSVIAFKKKIHTYLLMLQK